MRASLDVAPPEHVAPLHLYLASELASQVTGQIFAAGGFVGRYPRPAPALIGYRDHHESPQLTVQELRGLVGGRARA
jgi:hypothetical protein